MTASSLSNELDKKILLRTNHAITGVENLDLSDEKLELALLVETNTLSNDLQHVVYELRKLLANHYGNTNSNDQKLINSANSLAKVVNDLQETLTTNVTNTKTQLKTQLAKLPQEADNLSNFIKNSSDESDNTKVLHILNTLLTGIAKIDMRNNLEKRNAAEIQAILDANKIRKIGTLENINSNDKKTYNDLIHVARRSIEQMSDIAQALDDDAESFEGDAKQILHEVSSTLENALNSLRIAIHDSVDALSLTSAMIISARIVYVELDVLLKLFDDASNVVNTYIRLHSSILSAISDALGYADEYIDGVQQVAVQQK